MIFIKADCIFSLSFFGHQCPKDCHRPDLHVPTEMLVYKINNKVVCRWIWTKRSVHDTRLSDSSWSCLFDGYVCPRGSCVLGDPSENGKLFNGWCFAFPREAMSVVTMNPDGSVRVRPYNSWIFKLQIWSNNPSSKQCSMYCMVNVFENYITTDICIHFYYVHVIFHLVVHLVLTPILFKI